MNLQRVCFLFMTAAVLAWCIAAESGAVPAGAPAQISEETKYVALTFDDGPSPSTTPRLLDGLKERGASATFFLVGEQLSANEDLVRRMKAEGHQIGNHTWDHKKLQGESAETVKEEIEKTDCALCALLGEDVYWVRPPYGLLNADQLSWFKAPLVHWSVDPEDWRVKNTAADVRAVLGSVQAGDIILMHDTVAASVDAALQIVDTLEAQGYEFVTVEELLALNGIAPENGVMCHSARELS